METLEVVTTYYVSTTGNNGADGLDPDTSPWLTVDFAVTQLSAGDTLQLRAGTYYPPTSTGGITVDIAGTVGLPVVIESYTGERAWLYGGDVVELGSGDWEVDNAGINLWKTVNTVSFVAADLGAWMLDDEMYLITYNTASMQESTSYAPSGLNDYYAGPGIFGNTGDNKIYIRLFTNPNDLFDFDGNAEAAIFSDLDPNNHRISISSGTPAVFVVAATSSYITFRNLDVGPKGSAYSLASGCDHITIDDNYIMSTNIGIQIDGSDHEIKNCDMASGVFPWVWWGDTKEAPSPASFMEDIAHIEGPMVNCSIHDNTFRQAFDGIVIRESSADSSIYSNTFVGSRDDTIVMGPTITEIEIHHNIIQHSFEGISMSSAFDDASTIGNVYIHHNGINLSALHRMHRGGSTDDFFAFDYTGRAWKTSQHWGGHGETSNTLAGKWKIYNNTLIGLNYDTITEPDPVPGSASVSNFFPKILANDDVRFFNNVVYSIGGSGSALMFAVSDTHDPALLSMDIDGNIYFRNVTGSDIFEGMGGGTYATLAAFVADAGTSPWERTNSAEIDPGFDNPELTNTTFDIGKLAVIFHPTNSQVLTDGVTGEALVGFSPYRGAYNTLRSLTAATRSNSRQGRRRKKMMA